MLDGMREAAKSISEINPNPRGEANFGQIITNMSANLLLLGNFQFFQNIAFILLKLFSSFGTFILHRRFGSNAISMSTVIAGYLLIGICGLIVDGFNIVGGFFGSYISYAHYDYFSRLYFFFGVGHCIYRWYLDQFKPEVIIYSYSQGTSWLYKPWRQIWDRTGLKFWRSEASFHKIVEPLLVVLFGLILNGFLGWSIGKFLVFVGFAMHRIVAIQEKQVRKEIQALTDAKLVNSYLMQVFKGDQEEVQQNGLHMSEVVVNECRRAFQEKQPTDSRAEGNESMSSQHDDELRDLQRKQKLD